MRNMWVCSCAGFRHSTGIHAGVVLLDSDAFRPGLLGEVDDALGVLRVDRVVPDYSACSGVVVEGRVNEEEDVLVVRGR